MSFAISKPTKSDRWLSVVFDSWFCASENLLLHFEINISACALVRLLALCEFITLHHLPLWGWGACVCVFFAVEVWQKGWIDFSAGRGQLSASGSTSPCLIPRQQQPQQVIHVTRVLCQITPGSCTHKPVNHHLKFNSELWFVSGMKPGWKVWFFFSFFLFTIHVIVLRGHAEEMLAELWTRHVGDRKLLAYLFFFSFFLSAAYQTTCIVLLLSISS